MKRYVRIEIIFQTGTEIQTQATTVEVTVMMEEILESLGTSTSRQPPTHGGQAGLYFYNLHCGTTTCDAWATMS
jgi:hypothetical protein